MKRLLRVLGWILGVLVVAWLGVCAYFAVTHPRVTFTAEELLRPATPLPKGFLWGTATSSHQIEGGNTNDWTRFEAQPGAIERGRDERRLRRPLEPDGRGRGAHEGHPRQRLPLLDRVEPPRAAGGRLERGGLGSLRRPRAAAARGGHHAGGDAPALHPAPLDGGPRRGRGAGVPGALRPVRVRGRTAARPRRRPLGHAQRAERADVHGLRPRRLAAAEEVASGGRAGVRGAPARPRRRRRRPAGGRPRCPDRRRQQRDAARAEVPADAGRLARVDVRRPVLELGLRRRDPRRPRPAPPARGDPRRAHRRPHRVRRLLRPQLLLPLLRAPRAEHPGDLRDGARARPAQRARRDLARRRQPARGALPADAGGLEALPAADRHHRGRHRRRQGNDARPAHPRAVRGHPARARRGRRGRGLLPLDARRQLRVGEGLPAAVRPVPPRPADARPHARRAARRCSPPWPRPVSAPVQRTRSPSVRSRSVGSLATFCRSQPRCPAPKIARTRSSGEPARFAMFA